MLTEFQCRNRTKMKQFLIVILSFVCVFFSAEGRNQEYVMPDSLPWKNIFQTYNLPDSLTQLPAYKTGYDIRYSKDGEAGMWALTTPVARKYGLTVNEYVDERMDVELSTKAAAEYLNDLVHFYGNTDLAVLAYMNGAPLLNNTARKYDINLDSITGEDIGILSNLLPINRASLTFKTPDFSLDSIYNRTGYAQVKITSPLRAKTLVDSLNLKDDEFRRMNPSLRDFETWITDAFVYIPTDGSEEGPAIPDYLYACEKNALDLVVKAKEEALKAKIEKRKEEIKKATATKIYRVRSGDSLSRIARKYRVSVSQLKRWNNLRSDFLRVGQRLKIK